MHDGLDKAIDAIHAGEPTEECGEAIQGTKEPVPARSAALDECVRFQQVSEGILQQLREDLELTENAPEDAVEECVAVRPIEAGELVFGTDVKLSELPPWAQIIETHVDRDRVKLFAIDERFAIDVIRFGERAPQFLRVPVFHLPTGAVVHGIHYDIQRRAFVAKVAHGSFNRVASCSPIPFADEPLTWTIEMRETSGYLRPRR